MNSQPDSMPPADSPSHANGLSWKDRLPHPCAWWLENFPFSLNKGGVAVAALWLLLCGGLCGLLCLLFLTIPPDYDGEPPPPHWMEWLRFSGWAWIAVAGTLLALAQAWRTPRVWAATFAFLFVQSTVLAATVSSGLMEILRSPGGSGDLVSGISLFGPFWPFYLIKPLAAAGVAMAYFRARAWFGVEGRRGWRTVWFSGGGMLLLMGLLFAAILTVEHRYFR